MRRLGTSAVNGIFEDVKMKNQQQKLIKLQMLKNKCTVSLQIAEHQGVDFQKVCSLQDLAMKAVVSFITAKIQSVTSCLKLQNAPVLLEELQLFLHQSIPVPVWEELVPKLIDALLLLSVDISELRQILLLTVHPVTKSLQNYWQLEAMRILDAAERKERFSMVQVLKMNTIAHELLQEALPQLYNLEHFELPYHSTDEVIATLAIHCGKLKHLNVHGSKGVTNESVPAILSLNSLKSLNIAKTGIDVVGLDLLFCEIIVQRQENVNTLYLQCLEFSNGIRKNYGRLISAFPHLKHLGIYYVRSSLEVLSSLQELTSFLYYDGNFQHFVPLLTVVGRQFYNLHLEGIQNLDLNLLAKCCVRLRSLTLKSITNITDLPEHFFPSIRTLTIDSAQIAPEVIQRFVAQCSNLEKLIL